jgi:hypothetical protein
MIKDAGATEQKSPPPVRGQITNWDRAVVLHGMFSSLAAFVSASHIIPLATRVMAANTKEDIEAAKVELQKEFDRHQ